MKRPWFRKAGWLYLPVSLPGMLTALAAVALIVHDLIVIDRNSHSVSDTYYSFIPYGFIYCITYMWIAGNMSRSKKQQ